MKKLRKYALLIVIGAVSYSCYYDELPDEDLLPIPTGISFSEDVQPIFNRNCVSCHSGTQEPDLRTENSYDELINGHVVPFDADNSILFKTLIGQGAPQMPPGSPLNQSDINLVRQWINEGALNN